MIREFGYVLTNQIVFIAGHAVANATFTVSPILRLGTE
jgi:hypothetical protein